MFLESHFNYGDNISLLWVLYFILFGLVMWAIVDFAQRRKASSGELNDTALLAVERKYAMGEIDKEEYAKEKMRWKSS